MLAQLWPEGTSYDEAAGAFPELVPAWPGPRASLDLHALCALFDVQVGQSAPGRCSVRLSRRGRGFGQR